MNFASRRTGSLAAAALLLAVAGSAQATTAAKDSKTADRPAGTAPLVGKLTNLKVSGGENLVFKTTDTLSATAEGVTAAPCALLINSTATNMQPTGFVINVSASPFPQTRKFSNLALGSHTVTATPIPGPNGIPACRGDAITVKFTVK